MRLLFLAYYHKRYMQPLADYAGQFRSKRAYVKEMYPDDYYKEDVLSELADGAYDGVVYFGHGTPGRWVGYGSIGKEEFRNLNLGKAVQLLLSLSCFGFTPDRQGESLCSCFLQNRVAEWIVGYAGNVLYRHNLENLRYAMDLLLNNGIPEDPAKEFNNAELVVAKHSEFNYLLNLKKTTSQPAEPDREKRRGAARKGHL